ncbi:histidine kinase [Aureisphaera galaxeae]|uniref:sensor histidine kinase n=1 Tax=Aureisphaera galaxeae TaxID=1538023 RepID=UPI00234FF27E|nr:histidine kinase [Aureisphaera galaxeae]MDC8004255.1 histidine kinase [Aureisphaera galaxeae]
MKAFFTSRFAQHLLFWVCVFTYFIITSSMVFFRDYKHLTESTFTIIVPQIILAYVLLDFLIPKFLNQKKYALFIASTLFTLIIIFMCYVAVRQYYFDVEYIDTYNEIAKGFALRSYGERLMDMNMFFSKTVKFLTPAALLFTYRLFKNQQSLLQLREQKRLAELSALKNQLNPHFLFNTLNNLYALAIERSDKTPEVIERLSEMLDYMLYRCKDDYVSLEKEVNLIENYLALEKIRYGKRVAIEFENNSNGNVKIAPLILLTFIENAFKHGVSQELDQASIRILLNSNDEEISFMITNTKPNTIVQNKNVSSEALGLENVTKQLNLLYPEAYELVINDLSNSYEVHLSIPSYVV